MSRFRRAAAREDGFTLTEMLTVLAILGIIFAAMSMVLSMSIRQSSQIQEQSTLQAEVRATVDTMAREIRQAYTGDTTYPIETATSTTLQFLSPDKSSPLRIRRVAYRLSGGEIQRAMTTSTNTGAPPWTGLAWTTFASIPTSSWSRQVTQVANGAIFTYYNQAGTQLTGTITPSQVYRVKITVTVATKAAANRQFTYSSSASLRWAP